MNEAVSIAASNPAYRDAMPAERANLLPRLLLALPLCPTGGQIVFSTATPRRPHDVFNAQTKSTFLGVGPRLGVVGETPLGGGWSFDWLAGVAVLFGERTVQRTATAALASPATVESP